MGNDSNELKEDLFYINWDDFEQKKCDIPDRDFKVIRDLLQDRVGINLNDTKKIMVETRLSKRLKALDFDNYHDYIEFLKNDQHEMTEFINALTTNKTDFFRESDHFDFLLEEILPKAKSPFKIWSAASSTGEEIYTLAMVCEEYSQNVKHLDYKVLGTDIDTEVLEEADEGIYRSSIVSPIPPRYLQKYFLRSRQNGDLYKVDQVLKRNVKFRKFNLLADSLLSEVMFDVIFLRNVLIYFDRETIGKVIENITRYLKKGGYLFIGHSETLNGVNHKLESLKASIYKKE